MEADSTTKNSLLVIGTRIVGAEVGEADRVIIVSYEVKAAGSSVAFRNNGLCDCKSANIKLVAFLIDDVIELYIKSEVEVVSVVGTGIIKVVLSSNPFRLKPLDHMLIILLILRCRDSDKSLSITLSINSRSKPGTFATSDFL